MARDLSDPVVGAALGALERWLDGEPPETLAEHALPVAAAMVLPDAGIDLAAAEHDAKLYVDAYPFEGRAVGNLGERAATWLAQRLVLTGDADAQLERARVALGQLARELDAGRPLTADAFRRILEETAESRPPEDPLWYQLAYRIVEPQLP